jgi:NADH-quinone oxidoreductase subunit I
MTAREFFKKVFFVEILKGLALTFRHLFVKPITLQYPREKRVLPPGYRGIMSLLRYADGTERCVGCGLCEIACPSNVIKVVSAEQEDQPLKRYAKEYTFDVTRCVFCGFCVEACPVDALAMTPVYEYSVYNKRDLFFDKEKLLEMGDRYFPDQKPKPAYVGSCESELFLLTAKSKGYPTKESEIPEKDTNNNQASR